MSAPDLIASRYELQEELGEGGMGVVYRATDRLSGQDVALKRVLVQTEELQFKSRTDRTSAQVALAHEFQTLATLRHPHIISVLDYGFDGEQQAFFTMELLYDAQPLSDASSGLSIPEKIRLLIQVLEGLAYLHRRGLQHRDLKPTNILVKDGHTRILDFGLAVELNTDHTEISGTLPYMAPEAFAEAPPSVASDLYSLGVIAYELIVGSLPFEGDTVMELITNIREDDVDLIRIRNAVQAVQSSGKDESLLLLVNIIDRLLAKDPARRYADALTVVERFSAALDAPLPPESAAVRESFLQAARFVGRRKELDTLTAALSDAQTGQGSAWLIGGESGAGKSRLLEELRTRALVRNCRVLRGQGVEGGGLPYQLWREPLRNLALTAELDDVSIGILKDLVPDIETLLGRTVSDVPRVEGNAYHQRLSAVLIDCLRTQATPVVLLLEDLQWSVKSLTLLEYLTARVGDMPVLVAASYRDDERPDLPEQLPDMRLLTLERLDSTAIAALSRSMLGAAGTRRDILALLEKETEGNVFFLVETVRTLAEEAGQLSAVGTMELPETVLAGGVQAIVRRRLARVPVDYHALLEWAAVLGRSPDLAVLAHLQSGEALDDFLQTCQEAAVLEIQSEQWRFAHDKLREQVIADINDAPTVHRQAAEAIEAVYPDEDARRQRAAMLAAHWKIAGDAERAITYFMQAGQVAEFAGMSHQAVEFYEQVLELIDASHPQYNAVRYRLAMAYGQMDEYRQAADIVEQLIAAADDDRLRLDYRMEYAYYLINLESLQEAKDLALECLRIYEAQANEIGVCRANEILGIEAFRRGDYEESEIFYRRSLDLATRVRPERVVNLKMGLASIYTNFQQFEVASQYVQECIPVYEKRGDRRRLADCYNELGVIAGQSGDHETAGRYYQKAYEIASSLGLRFMRAMLLVNLGITTKNLERFDQAIAHYDEALPVFRNLENRFAVVAVLINRGIARRMTGDLQRARNDFEDGLRLALEIGAAALVQAILKNFAELAYHEGDLARSTELATYVERIGKQHQGTQKDIQELLTILQKELPDEVYTAARESGQSLDEAAVLAMVLPE